MDDYEILQDYICDVWSEIDHLLRGDQDQNQLYLETWMNILGIFQSKADSFNIDRTKISLPAIDADQLFIQYSKDM